LRAEFGQEQGAKREGDEPARRETLCDQFAKDRAGARKTPEQMRQALKERAKPARESGRGRGRDKGGGRGIDR